VTESYCLLQFGGRGLIEAGGKHDTVNCNMELLLIVLHVGCPSIGGWGEGGWLHPDLNLV